MAWLAEGLTVKAVVSGEVGGTGYRGYRAKSGLNAALVALPEHGQTMPAGASGREQRTKPEPPDVCWAGRSAVVGTVRRGAR
jgi:hypothetical protein